MAKRVGVAIEVAMNFQLADAMDAGTNEVSKLTGDGHFLMKFYTMQSIGNQ
jgi:hypothetical protein